MALASSNGFCRNSLFLFHGSCFILGVMYSGSREVTAVASCCRTSSLSLFIIQRRYLCYVTVLQYSALCSLQCIVRVSIYFVLQAIYSIGLETILLMLSSLITRFYATIHCFRFLDCYQAKIQVICIANASYQNHVRQLRERHLYHCFAISYSA